MAGVFVWGWDSENEKWIPIELTDTGYLKVEMSGTYSPDIVIITDGAGHYLQLPSLTTAQRNVLTAVNGMVIYNSTTNQIESYENGVWGAIGGVPPAATDERAAMRRSMVPAWPVCWPAISMSWTLRWRRYQ